MPPGPRRLAAGNGPLLVALVLLATVTAIVSSLGAPLVPAIAAQYDVPLSAAQWALTATLLAGAVSTPLLGRLGTGRLRRPVVLGALVVVLAGTLLATLPLPGPAGFVAVVAGRALQGVGMGLVPLALAVARDVWEGERLASVVALLSVSTVAGAGFGYPLTAVVADHLGLTGAYLVGAVLVTVTLALAWRTLPDRAGAPPHGVDGVGVLLLGLGMVSLLLAVSQGDRWGWTSYGVAVLAPVGVALLGAWVARSLGVARAGGTPLVDLRLATRPGVGAPNAVAFVAGVGMYGLLTLAVLVVQADPARSGYGLDLGVTAAGLVLVPYALLSVSGSRVARAVSRRWGEQVLLPLGCTGFGAALVWMSLAHHSLWQVLGAMALGGLGSGFTFSSLAVILVPRVPAEETSSALAFNQLLRYLGFSVGSALSVALVDAYGAGESGLRTALLTLAGLYVVLVAGLLARRPGRRRGTSAPTSAPAARGGPGGTPTADADQEGGGARTG